MCDCFFKVQKFYSYLNLNKTCLLTSYNVEGLSPMLSDKSFIEKITKYDFISLIETWLPEGFNINIPGFFSMSKYRKKNKEGQTPFRWNYSFSEKFN